MKTFQIGPHVLIFEPPDLQVFIFCGVVRAQDADEYAAERGPLLDGLPYVLNLIDIRKAAGFEPESRKTIATIAESRPTATALVGGSFALRIIVEMMVKAARIVGKRKSLNVRFFPDEPEARAWLAEMRERFKAT